MNTLFRFLRDRRAVSPVIGTILMVAITVVMAAIVGTFVYQTGKPKSSPNLSTTLEDDVRVILTSGTTNEGRVAKLFIEGGARVTKAELAASVTYIDGAGAEQTVALDGASWGDGVLATPPKEMGSGKIGLDWVDADGSGDLSPGDRLDFTEEGVAVAQNVKMNSDFTVKVVHKSSESVLASHTIRVY